MNTTMQLEDCLYAIDTPFPYSQGSYVRSYLVKGQAGLALIDAGAISTHQQVIDLLAELGEEKSRLKVIALTHAHGDHVGSVNSLRAATGCLVAVNRAGVEFLSNIELMFQDFMGSFPREFPLTPEIRASWFSIACESSNPDIQFEEDSFRLDLGGIILEAKSAPGHSKDSVCWYEPRRGWLFTGDAICGLGPFSETPCYRDVDIYRTTLGKIGKLRIDTLYTAHFPVMDRQNAVEFFDKSAEVVNQFDAVVRKQLQNASKKPTFQEIASSIAGAIGKEHMVNTLFTTRAHLLDLEKKGMAIGDILGAER